MPFRLHMMKKEVEKVLLKRWIGWFQTEKVIYRSNCNPRHLYRTNHRKAGIVVPYICGFRESIWYFRPLSTMEHSKIPWYSEKKNISIIRQLYDGFIFQVIHGGTLQIFFLYPLGFCKGVYSLLLFLMVIHWVSKLIVLWWTRVHQMDTTVMSCPCRRYLSTFTLSLKLTRTSFQPRIKCQKGWFIHQSN